MALKVKGENNNRRASALLWASLHANQMQGDADPFSKRSFELIQPKVFVTWKAYGFPNGGI